VTGPEGDESPSGAPVGEPAPARRRTRWVFLVAAAVLALDAISKAVVVATLSDHSPVRVLGGLFYLVEARNTGAAFSLAAGATIIFTLIAVAVVVIIVRAASRLRSIGWAVAFGLILGGAAGNLVDRLARAPGPLRGAVVDWISLLDPYGRVWPIFNLADSAIVCGGICAVVLVLFGYDIGGGRRTGRRPK
jgi:signal peptidase II